MDAKGVLELAKKNNAKILDLRFVDGSQSLLRVNR